MYQATSILQVLDVAGRDLLIQRLPKGGWRVETEQTNGVEGIACDGSSLSDALAQVAQVLALELGIDPQAVPGAAWTHDELADADGPAPYAVEPLILEFAPAVSEYDRRMLEASSVGGTLVELEWAVAK